MDQNDIDALMNDIPDPDDDSSGAGDAAHTPNPEDSVEDSGDIGISQSDLDALMQQAQNLADEPVATPASAEAAAGDFGALDSTGKPLDEAGAAMAAAIAAERAEQEAAAAAAAAQAAQAPAPPPAANVPVEEIELPEFDVSEITKQANQPLSLLYDVEMHVKIELGRTQMYVEDILKLGQGSVVELDRFAGDPVDVYVNGRMVARGEVLVLNDNFCVRVSEIIANPDARLAG